MNTIAELFLTAPATSTAPGPAPALPQGQALLFTLLLPFRLVGGVLRATLEMALRVSINSVAGSESLLPGFCGALHWPVAINRQ